MKNRILSLFLSLCLLIALLPQVVVPASAQTMSGTIGNGLSWTFDSETGTLVISGNGNLDGIYEYPWTPYANNIRYVILEKGINKVNDYLFCDYSELIKVTIPDTVKSIGSLSFSQCTKLTDLTIPDSVTYISGSAFYGCSSLEEVIIPNGVESIGMNAFMSCGLTRVSIPASVTNISSNAFYANDFVEIRVDENNAYYTNDEMGSLLSKDMTQLIQCPTGKENVHYSIPDSVTWIESKALAGWSGLLSVTIPNSVEAVGSLIFAQCTGLTSVIVPDSITTLGSYMFSDCTGLSSVVLPDTVYEIVYGAFEGCTALKDVYYTGTEEKWNEIYIGMENEALSNATIHFNYVPQEQEPTENPFGDVKDSDYFAQPVLWAVEQGITTGTSAGKFSPERACTRGQIVTFLWRAAGSPEPTSTDNPFTDISSMDYYYKAVLWAVENEITTGTGKGKFSPEKPCTRGQVATFLWRAEGKPEPASTENPFGDIASEEYYYDAVLWAVEQGITNGTGKGKFSPDKDCTRGQIVTFLYRAMA